MMRDALFLVSCLSYLVVSIAAASLRSNEDLTPRSKLYIPERSHARLLPRMTGPKNTGAKEDKKNSPARSRSRAEKPTKERPTVETPRGRSPGRRGPQDQPSTPRDRSRPKSPKTATPLTPQKQRQPTPPATAIQPVALDFGARLRLYGQNKVPGKKWLSLSKKKAAPVAGSTRANTARNKPPPQASPALARVQGQSARADSPNTIRQTEREMSWLSKGKWTEGKRPFQGHPNGMTGRYTYGYDDESPSESPKKPSRSPSPAKEKGFMSDSSNDDKGNSRRRERHYSMSGGWGLGQFDKTGGVWPM